MTHPIRYPKLNQLTLYRGLEKEGLRVNTNGRIATTAHPKLLGSALKNPVITTDFAEALTEIITGVHDNSNSLFDEINDINRFLIHHLPNNETLWPASMPPYIENENTIALAQYGTSPIAKMKSGYRQGLTKRYGKAMQCIAGLHYNLSFNAELFIKIAALDNLTFDSEQKLKSHYYMKLVRHFLAQDWLLILLFGASPIAARSSLPSGTKTTLQQHNATTFFSPNATSLRLSSIGYHNAEIDHTQLHFDTCQNYANDLFQLTQTPSQLFNEIPALFETNAQQLSKNILQIENEYYNHIRPKPQFISEQAPSSLLYHHGVQYIEMRVFDLNPLEPLGFTPTQLALTDVFCTHCLLQPELNFSLKCALKNKTRVIDSGLLPNQPLTGIQSSGTTQSLGLKLLRELLITAQWMDQFTPNQTYEASVQAQIEKLTEWTGFIPTLLLDHLNDYPDFILSLSQQHHQRSKETPLTPERQKQLSHLATTSVKHQTELERKNADVSFKDYYQQIQKKQRDFHRTLTQDAPL